MSVRDRNRVLENDGGKRWEAEADRDRSRRFGPSAAPRVLKT